MDHTELYAKANAMAPELFREIPIDQRKEKLDREVCPQCSMDATRSVTLYLCSWQISRLQQEVQLQERIRDELVVEYNSKLADGNEKRKIQARIANVDEKIQALGKMSRRSSSVANEPNLSSFIPRCLDHSLLFRYIHSSDFQRTSLVSALLGVQYCCAQMEMTNDHGNLSTGAKINSAFDDYDIE